MTPDASRDERGDAVPKEPTMSDPTPALDRLVDQLMCEFLDWQEWKSGKDGDPKLRSRFAAAIAAAGLVLSDRETSVVVSREDMETIRERVSPDTRHLVSGRELDHIVAICDAALRPRRAGIPMTGEQVKSGIADAARRLGFLVHVIEDSRRIDSGWPDLVIVGHGVLLAVEAKSRGERLRPAGVTRSGRAMTSQADWLTAFATTPGAMAYVCRPKLEDIETPSGPWRETHYDALLAMLTEARDRAIGR